MPYSPQTWIDGNSSYPLSAARMGVIETGVQTAATIADQGHRILTTTQKTALGAVTTGTMVYDSTLNQLQVYDGSAWVATGSTMPAAAKVSRGAGAITNPMSYTTVAFDSTGSTMWSAGQPTRIVLPFAGYYSIGAQVNGTSHATLTKDIYCEITHSVSGRVTAQQVTAIAANKLFYISCSDIVKTTTANTYVTFSCSNSDGTDVSNMSSATLSAALLGT